MWQISLQAHGVHSYRELGALARVHAFSIQCVYDHRTHLESIISLFDSVWFVTTRD